jgi:bifunctional UDP-N-acetylglucosamine pyrophosphorylase / glucosamine-1-phosphate N-acetyltransferase
MTQRSCLAIVLAAGEGTRMRSNTPKVLHTIGNRTLLDHVLSTAMAAGGAELAVVLGPDHGAVGKEARRVAPQIAIFEQRERLGTAHAVLSAREVLAKTPDDVLVMFGDTPLIRVETLQRLRDALAHGAAVAVLGFTPADPTGYGRLVTDKSGLAAIREHADASEAERAIGMCNGGLMALAGEHALAILERIGNENANREYYLTDAVAIARGMGLKAVAVETPEDDVRGINTKAQLAEAEAVLQKRLRAAAMEAGVTMVMPDSVFLSSDTTVG